MKKLYETDHDFEARVTILTEKDGGKRTVSFNGIRWSFVYAEDDPRTESYMIFPDFHDDEGNSLPEDVPLKGTLNARMHVLFQESIDQVHGDRIAKGVEFYCTEGNRRVAKGVVTKLRGILAHE